MAKHQQTAHTNQSINERYYRRDHLLQLLADEGAMAAAYLSQREGRMAISRAHGWDVSISPPAQVLTV